MTLCTCISTLDYYVHAKGMNQELPFEKWLGQVGTYTSLASHRLSVTSRPVGQWTRSPALSWGHLEGRAHLIQASSHFEHENSSYVRSVGDLASLGEGLPRGSSLGPWEPYN